MKGDYNRRAIPHRVVVVRDDPHMKGDYNDSLFNPHWIPVRDDPHMKGDYNVDEGDAVTLSGSR